MTDGSTEGGRRKGSAWRRKRAGFALSVALHAAILFAWVPLMGGGREPSLAGSDGGVAMTVSLVRANTFRPPAEPPEGGGLRPLFAKFDTGERPVVAGKAAGADMAQLFTRVAAAQPAAPSRKIPTSFPYSIDEQFPSEAERGAQSDGLAGASEGRGGDLWGVVEPCWDAMRHKSAESVVLELSVNAAGYVSTPPHILRPSDAAPDERRLRAEAEALSALSSCMRQGDPRFGGRSFRLRFVPSRSK